MLHFSKIIYNIYIERGENAPWNFNEFELAERWCSKSASLNVKNSKLKNSKTIRNDAFNSNVNTVRLSVGWSCNFKHLRSKTFSCRQIYTYFRCVWYENVGKCLHSSHRECFKKVQNLTVDILHLLDIDSALVCAWMWVMSVVDWPKPKFTKTQPMCHSRHGSSRKSEN